MGRALLCAPYFSTVVLAANALVHSGDDAAKAAYLPGIASGETIATLAEHPDALPERCVRVWDGGDDEDAVAPAGWRTRRHRRPAHRRFPSRPTCAPHASLPCPDGR